MTISEEIDEEVQNRIQSLEKTISKLKDPEDQDIIITAILTQIAQINTKRLYMPVGRLTIAIDALLHAPKE